jgi:hypothetical protein
MRRRKPTKAHSHSAPNNVLFGKHDSSIRAFSSSCFMQQNPRTHGQTLNQKLPLTRSLSAHLVASVPHLHMPTRPPHTPPLPLTQTHLRPHTSTPGLVGAGAPRPARNIATAPPWHVVAAASRPLCTLCSGVCGACTGEGRVG